MHIVFSSPHSDPLLDLASLIRVGSEMCIRDSTYPTNKKVMGVTVDASLTFANATYVYSKIMKSLKINKKPKYVLILCSKINNIDASAEEVLIDLYSDLKDMGITLLLSGLQEHVIREMKITKVYDFIGGENIYPRTSIALKAIYATETK